MHKMRPGILDLPRDVLEIIVHMLDDADLRALSHLCRRLRTYASAAAASLRARKYRSASAAIGIGSYQVNDHGRLEAASGWIYMLHGAVLREPTIISALPARVRQMYVDNSDGVSSPTDTISIEYGFPTTYYHIAIANDSHMRFVIPYVERIGEIHGDVIETKYDRQSVITYDRGDLVMERQTLIFIETDDHVLQYTRRRPADAAIKQTMSVIDYSRADDPVETSQTEQLN